MNNSDTTTGKPAGVLFDLLREFNGRFLDDNFCRRWLLNRIYPDGVIVCPKCQRPLSGKKLHQFYAGERNVCTGCGHRWSTFRGTALNWTHHAPGEIIIIGFLYALGCEEREIAERLNRQPLSIKNILNSLSDIDKTVNSAQGRETE